eukprot:gene45992-62295_t
MCLILDRGGAVLRNGKKKQEKRDMGVIPNLVILLRHLYGTIADNYPEVFASAKIVPSSWFFSMCYKVTSRVMDSSHRDRFVMIRGEDAAKEMRPLFDPEYLPAHLGGHSSTYTSTVNIEYHPVEASNPK